MNPLGKINRTIFMCQSRNFYLIIIFFISGACSSYAQLDVGKDLPLKPSRTISFTTTEGTSMDIDLSPDGKKLAVTLLGDIYILPVNGGRAIQITKGLAVNSKVMWSPNGSKLAFISDGSGYPRWHVINEQGTYHKIINGNKDLENAIWSPDGYGLIFNQKKYYLIGGDGMPTNFNIHLGSSKINIIDFSTDGNKAYLAERKPSSKGEESCLVSCIDFISNEKTVLADLSDYFSIKNVTVSPDRKSLIFFREDKGELKRSAQLIQYLIGEKKEVLIKQIDVAPGYFIYPSYVLTRDSKSLIINTEGKIRRLDLASGEEKIIPFVANVKVDMGKLVHHDFKINQDELHVKYTRWASLRPDGKQIVFEALNKIYVKDLPNEKPRVLLVQPDAQFQPAYSPDGKWIAFVTWQANHGGALWRIPTAGGRPEKLTSDSGFYQYPSWSPNGKAIVYYREDSLKRIKGKIEIISIEDRKITSFRESASVYNYPHFDSIGKKLYYRAEQSEGARIPHMLARNLETNRVDTALIATSDGFWWFNIRDIRISPNGRFACFSLYEELFLVVRSPEKQPLLLYDEQSHPPVIHFASGTDPNWSNNGDLNWTFGGKFYSIDPAKILSTAKPAIGNIEFLEANAPADRIINLDLVVPKLVGKETIALVNATVLTMESGKIIPNGTIILKKGRIENVEKSSVAKIPEGAITIDLAGKVVMPGFVDLHLHTKSTTLANVLVPSWTPQINLAYGITCARDPGGSFEQFGYAELFATGQQKGPRYYSAGGPVRKDRYRVLNEADFELKAEAIARNRVAMGGTDTKQYGLDPRRQVQQLLIATDRAKINMTNEGSGDNLKFLQYFKDGSTGYEHNPSWGDVHSDVIELMSRSGTYLTPTLQVQPGGFGLNYFHKYYKDRHDAKLERFMDPKFVLGMKKYDSATANDKYFVQTASIDAQLLRKGMTITMGSHGNDQGIGAHFEIWAFVMGGMTPIEALQCATINGAKAMGLDKEIGSLKKGKIADLLILDKNPLEDIHNTTSIKYVVKDGIFYNGDNLEIISPKNLVEAKR